jgi:cytosine/adenosine deaminase-related metal-dependent hydrolase
MLLKNANILFENHSILFGDVLVENGFIKKVFIGGTEGHNVKNYDIYDCRSNFLIPGLINSYVQIDDYIFKGTNPIKSGLNNDFELSDDDIYWFTKLAILDAVAGGTTSIIAESNREKVCAKAAEEMGFNIKFVNSEPPFAVTEIEEIAAVQTKTEMHTIATGNPANSNSINMLAQMNFLARHNPELTPLDITNMATINAAKILEKNAGLIKDGYNADLVLIELGSPNNFLGNPINNLVYSTTNADVKFTMIAGQFAYFNNDYQSPMDVSIDDIANECRERAKKIFKVSA